MAPIAGLLPAAGTALPAAMGAATLEGLPALAAIPELMAGIPALGGAMGAATAPTGMSLGAIGALGSSSALPASLLSGVSPLKALPEAFAGGALPTGVEAAKKPFDYLTLANLLKQTESNMDATNPIKQMGMDTPQMGSQPRMQQQMYSRPQQSAYSQYLNNKSPLIQQLMSQYLGQLRR